MDIIKNKYLLSYMFNIAGDITPSGKTHPTKRI